METFTKEQRSHLLYAIKCAFKMAQENDYEGILNYGKKIYEDKDKRKLFNSLPNNSIELNILVQLGRDAKNDIINWEYTDKIKNLVKGYAMLKRDTITVPQEIVKTELPIKPIEPESGIRCNHCGAKSEFTDEDICHTNPETDLKIYCEYCDRIIAIYKVDKRWIKYEATTDKGIIYLRAVDEEHAYSKLQSLGYKKPNIISLKNITKPSSIENMEDINIEDMDLSKEEPSNKDIEEANKEVISKQNEDQDF